jgi:hypothetical protein
MAAAELADRMSSYLGVANRPASRSTAAERRAQAERVRAEFREVFDADLRRACHDLVRHGVMTAHEDKIVHLALDGSTIGLHAVAALLADRARQLVSRSEPPVSP